MLLRKANFSSSRSLQSSSDNPTQSSIWCWLVCFWWRNFRWWWSLSSKDNISSGWCISGDMKVFFTCWEGIGFKGSISIRCFSGRMQNARVSHCWMLGKWRVNWCLEEQQQQSYEERHSCCHFGCQLLLTWYLSLACFKLIASKSGWPQGCGQDLLMQ